MAIETWIGGKGMRRATWASETACSRSNESGRHGDAQSAVYDVDENWI